MNMTRKILIDARQPEETRVASINDNLVDDFEYEVNEKKQLRGNIYLARVTRVEPSLQAAFVEYGGNRQGFLAFSEIHPDYYRIPIEDREKILASVEENGNETEEISFNEDKDENNAEEEEINSQIIKKTKAKLYKNYKIQEVIVKRQILLVQVVKEERGNKGAALTSYLSIAGRYCVLMPNTPKGGGVSRKIINNPDRQRLKKIVEGLNVPSGIAVIIRTAGSKRTKVEIKRDFQNLLTIWEDVKSKTLESNAPNLIHEEGSIIKRTVRDMYNSDIEEIVVEGEKAFKACKDFMKALMPSHVKKVQQYKDTQLPLFQKYTIDSQLADIFKPVVTLPSGGYLVINHTEALVAVDVNSGKATRERSIEKTALQTNIEAAEEISKQAKLRDLSGLIVIDFIDMEEYKNRHTIERKLKESLKKDRARIQVGEISNFGLLEMSRQRLRPSVSEISSELCEHCGGIGRIQSLEVSAMQILRSAEEKILEEKIEKIKIKLNSNVSIYILNNKFQQLKDLEERQNVKIIFENDNNIFPPNFEIEISKESSIENHQEIKSEKNKWKSGEKNKTKDKKKKNNQSIASLLDEKQSNIKEIDNPENKNLKHKKTKLKNSKKEKMIKTDSTNSSDNEFNHKPETNNITKPEEKKPKKRTRKKSSSKKIDIVDINNKETKNQPKKTGWWNN